ncbi:ABC transporter permease [Anaerococcus sp. Marseille-Q5996]|uniref:ABC transporter permease n=1 Tax=Anaerococcus sp. Marseille-Q5996 TaxID=2972769 RepID=UPI0021C78B4E|nr:ABC transporter permease subunit [Anaerococcus sp. Marseille-Q5996]
MIYGLEIPEIGEILFDVLSVLYILTLIIFSIGIPYFSIIATSLINLRGYGLKAGNFTGKHYVELFQNRSAAKRALLTSFGLGAATAIICAIVGTFIVVSLYRQGKWKKYLENIAILPEMIPNIVFVIGLMIFWNKIYNVIPLYNTVGFMILVYSVMFLPFTIQYVSSSFLQMGDNLIQAAKISGASISYTFRKIILPLIAPSISSVAMMTLIISFRELVASSIISPPNVMTVSTYITSEFEQGSVSVGMAMAVVCVLITTSLLIIINVLNNRRNIK